MVSGMAMFCPMAVKWWMIWTALVMGSTDKYMRFGSFLMFSMHFAAEMVSIVKFVTSTAFFLWELLLGLLAKTWDQFDYFIVVNKLVF